MSTTTTKFALGVAALAMTGASLVNPALAQAENECLPGETLECVATSNFNVTALAQANAAPAASAVGDTPTRPIIQNNIVWIQTNGINQAFATDPGTVQVWTFKPLTVLPPAIANGPIGTWFKSRNQQSCFLGITTTLGGPYAEPGQYVHSYNRKGCNLGWTT